MRTAQLQVVAMAASIVAKERSTIAVFRSLINEGQGKSMQAALDYEIDTVLQK